MISNSSINVYSFDEKDYSILPLQVSEIHDAELTIDLLYYKNGENSHYVLIKDLSRLISSQLSKDSHKLFICRRCLCHFYSKEKLDDHLKLCKNYEAIKTNYA